MEWRGSGFTVNVRAQPPWSLGVEAACRRGVEASGRRGVGTPGATSVCPARPCAFIRVPMFRYLEHPCKFTESTSDSHFPSHSLNVQLDSSLKFILKNSYENINKIIQSNVRGRVQRTRYSNASDDTTNVPWTFLR